MRSIIEFWELEDIADLESDIIFELVEVVR